MAVKKKVTKKATAVRSVPKKRTAAKKKPASKVKKAPKQTGSSDRFLDKLVQAKPVGKRKSASGKTYYEYRANRSDKGKLLGIGKLNSGAVATKRLTQYASASGSPLVRAVVKSIKSHSSGYDSPVGFINDLLRGGCESGIVGELIYYKDTLAFFKRHQKEITQLMYDLMQDIGGTSPADLFGKKWDLEDPFARDTTNQNLLAWFGYEETARKINDELFDN